METIPQLSAPDHLSESERPVLGATRERVSLNPERLTHRRPLPGGEIRLPPAPFAPPERGAMKPPRRRRGGQPKRTLYDELPYPNLLHPETHPARMGAKARLWGLAAAGANRCRVLELGCARGANLIQMARDLPGSEFVGLDLSRHQIEEARRDATLAKVENLRLECRDFRSLNSDEGSFDYIIAHGLFSWISPEAQEEMLALLDRMLTPHGVALVSFNTLPGWYLRSAYRDLAQWHTRKERNPRERVRQAREFGRFLAQNIIDRENPFAYYLRWERDQLEGEDASYYAHEILASENNPMAFTDFVDLAGRFRLQYLCDATYGRFLHSALGAELQEKLGSYTEDPFEREQYADYLVARMFRRALICRSARPISAEPVRAMLTTLSARAAIVIPEGIDCRTETLTRFVIGNVPLETASRVEKAAFVALGRAYPQAIPFKDLLFETRRLSGLEAPGLEREVREALGSLLVFGNEHGLFELSTV